MSETAYIRIHLVKFHNFYTLKKTWAEECLHAFFPLCLCSDGATAVLLISIQPEEVNKSFYTWRVFFLLWWGSNVLESKRNKTNPADRL